jgi:hypothetical protein
MNKLKQTAFLPIAAFLFLADQGQSMTTAPGDVLLSFYQVTSAGTGVETNTYIYNLGPGNVWRDTTATTTAIANLNADLKLAFGDDWSSNPNLRMIIVGGVGSTDAAVSGDPVRTIYFTQAMAQFAPTQSSSWTWSSGVRGTVSTNLTTFRTAMNGQPSTGVLPNAAKVDNTVTSSLTNFVSPTATTNFGASLSPFTSFGPGTIGTGTGGYPVEAAVDLYRVLHTLTGATLTSNKSTGNAVVGAAQYIGAFTIATNGDLRYDIPAVAQSPYDTWKTQNNLIGNDALPTADPDKDGISNGIEFIIGGNPNQQGDASKLPTATAGSGGSLVFQYRRTDAAFTKTVVEHDTDLMGPWTPLATEVVENDFYNATTDRVTVTIPSAGGRNFARLRFVP